MKRSRCLMGVVFLGLGGLPAARAVLPPNFVDLEIVSGLNQATGMTFASDGRLFVWEKAGLVWIIENGVKSAAPMLDIREEVGNWGDYGLLGFALDPEFLTNGYVYLLYVVDYHHLINFGTSNYDPLANQFNHDTIGRITRYTANASDGFRSVDYGSRLVLLGESITTGFPMCHGTHGVAHLAFGEDGTLLATVGDGNTGAVLNVGGCASGSSCTCLSDGIITPAEDVGSYRAQLVDSLSGKLLRLDPATGAGVDSNPWYDAMNPRSARSRVFALGLRNAFRFAIRPGTGHPDPLMANPGTIYIGDVGWHQWEELDKCDGPGQNFGWPAYEGMTTQTNYYNSNVYNRLSPNPLFGTTPPGQSLCMQEFFYFRDLILQDSLNPAPMFANPCDPTQEIPASLDRFVHRRPMIDYRQGTGPSRTAIYSGQSAAVINIGATNSPVVGPQFGGNCVVAGAWYTGTAFPSEYRNTLFFADAGENWIRTLEVDANDQPVQIRDFALGLGRPIGLTFDPTGSALYYLYYGPNGVASVRKIEPTINVAPVAVAGADPNFGAAPVAIQLRGSASFDPDNTGPAPMSFSWDFGDGSPVSAEVDPVHVYPSQDITMEGSFIGKIFSLTPPMPTGGGNKNPEVMRDGDFPPVGNRQSIRQYDTSNLSNLPPEDWLGYQFPQPRLLSSMIFQEGREFHESGWFDDLHVQVLVNGVWGDVSGLVVTPPYPGANGLTFETFRFRFDPILADAIRIYGDPGGTANFISVGELRVIGSPANLPMGPANYMATVTVTDAAGGSDVDSVVVSLNNTPPFVQITNPFDGSQYLLSDAITIDLTADISDAEHDAGSLTCRWETLLHHNNHTHPEPLDFNCTTTTTIAPHGGQGDSYFYEINLVVTDPLGLSTTATTNVFPILNECTDDADCHDDEPCTTDACVGSACEFTPISGPCDDGLFCTSMDECAGGVCVGAQEACPGQFCDESGDRCVDCQVDADCDDGDACTTDACQPVAGTCDHVDTSSDCDDGLVCNGVEACNAILGCVSGSALDCDDLNACTVDACEEPTGDCTHVDTSAACDDGLTCTGLETCDPGSGCVAGAAVSCDDNVACTVDACEEPSGDCGHVPDDAQCDDGVFCNGVETCDPLLGCQTGLDPCAGGLCNETARRCGGASTTVWMSFRGPTDVPGVGVVESHDVVALELSSGLWSLVIDGSDLGIDSFTIDGLARLPTGEVLFSFTKPGSIPGLIGGPNGLLIDDCDVIALTPSSLGDSTAGLFTFYFDGSDVGLSPNVEDLDALDVTTDGRLVVSSVAGFFAGGATGADEDLMVFNAVSLGANTSGVFDLYFDGSDIALTNTGEDVAGAASTSVGTILISTEGGFSVPGVSGVDEDVLEFTPTSLGSTTTGTSTLYLDLSTMGIAPTGALGAISWVE